MILEADTITGPWRMVGYMEGFGEQAYFLSFPSKFISKDGRTLWLCYSANFTTKYLPIQQRQRGALTLSREKGDLDHVDVAGEALVTFRVRQLFLLRPASFPWRAAPVSSLAGAAAKLQYFRLAGAKNFVAKFHKIC